MNKKEVLRMDYTKKLLEVRDLHKAYSKEGVPTKALNGITFDANIWELWEPAVPGKQHY